MFLNSEPLLINTDPQISLCYTDYYPHIEAIYLFGSYAHGQATDRSDIDLALLSPAPDSKLIDSLVLNE